LKVVRAGLFLLVLAALAAVPMVATDFQLFRHTNIVIDALALIGMNLLVGYNGQVSLGHGAFHAIGAYATAFSRSTTTRGSLATSLMRCPIDSR